MKYGIIIKGSEIEKKKEPLLEEGNEGTKKKRNKEKENGKR